MSQIEAVMAKFHHAYPSLALTAGFKQAMEDFRVEEDLGFEPSGSGEHMYLLMQKQGMNTEQLADELAAYFKVARRLVTYAGMKDRQGITSQWFCVHLPGKDAGDLSGLVQDNFRMLSVQRHHKKLKIGYLKGNRFRIVLRNVAGEKQETEQRLMLIAQEGVPNYYGPQRFGHRAQNLVKAEQVLLANKKIKNKFLRGIYYSTARAYLFNHVLSYRVESGYWNKALPGDAMQLAGSKSYFLIDDIDEEIKQRIIAHDIAPSGPLWGQGSMPIKGQALLSLNKALEEHQPWCDALESFQLNLAFRPLVLCPREFKWQWQEQDLVLNFYLPAGSYATSVLRELGSIDGCGDA